MNKWLVLLAVIAGFAGSIGAVVLVIAWWARRYERANGIGPDDGRPFPAASPIDYAATDQALHDAPLHHD